LALNGSNSTDFRLDFDHPGTILLDQWRRGITQKVSLAGLMGFAPSGFERLDQSDLLVTDGRQGLETQGFHGLQEHFEHGFVNLRQPLRTHDCARQHFAHDPELRLAALGLQAIGGPDQAAVPFLRFVQFNQIGLHQTA
jgi:hypothetical protein